MRRVKVEEKEEGRRREEEEEEERREEEGRKEIVEDEEVANRRVCWTSNGRISVFILVRVLKVEERREARKKK